VVGRFTGTDKFTVVHDPALGEAAVEAADPRAMPAAREVGLDVPYRLLKYDPEPAAAPTAPVREVRKTAWPAWDAAGLAAFMPRLLADVEVQDQSLADSQYDSSVQGRHSYGPYEGSAERVPTSWWAAQMLAGHPGAALFATAFHPWLFEANPKLAARQAFFEALGKMALAGAKVRDVALCDNFYTPHLSDDWAWWLVEMVDELARLVRLSGSPLISGKDSSAGSVRTPNGAVHVPPAVFLSALAKAPSFAALLRNEWKSEGSVLVQIGPGCRSAAGTAAARALGSNPNDVDEFEPEALMKFLAALESADREGWRSGVWIGPGGILAALTRRALAGRWRAEIDPPPEGLWWLATEHRCGAVIEVEPGREKGLAPELEPRVIGRVAAGGPAISLDGMELLTGAALDRYRNAFEEAVR
jgi:phosphoribosylformylglycinamidine synthase